MFKDRESGATLIELAAVLAVASVAFGITVIGSLPQISKEEMRGAAYDVYSHLQLARVEAVSRNVECQFLIDTALRRIAVVDTKGTPNVYDDEILHRTSLPETVAITRPDSGLAVTFEGVSTTRYRVRFGQDGSVLAGSGSVHLFGGSEYRRVSVLGAGGVEVSRWNGDSWKLGR